jgi:hypothetical protein
MRCLDSAKWASMKQKNSDQTKKCNNSYYWETRGKPLGNQCLEGFKRIIFTQLPQFECSVKWPVERVFAHSALFVQANDSSADSSMWELLWFIILLLLLYFNSSLGLNSQKKKSLGLVSGVSVWYFTFFLGRLTLALSRFPIFSSDL